MNLIMGDTIIIGLYLLNKGVFGDYLFKQINRDNRCILLSSLCQYSSFSIYIQYCFLFLHYLHIFSRQHFPPVLNNDYGIPSQLVAFPCLIF